MNGSSAFLDGAPVGIEAGIIHPHLLAVGEGHPVANRGRGQNQRKIVLAPQPFLDDLEVEQAEKATAEAEPECDRRVLLVGQGGIVELELFEGLAEVRVLLGRHRVHRGEDNRFGLFVARQRFWRPLVGIGDGVADRDIRYRLDPGDDVAHHSRGQLFGRDLLDLEQADLLDA